MTLYAVSNDRTGTVHGQDGSFLLDGGTVADNDSIGPSIYCYLNSKSFVNGGNVNATPYFGAELYDDDGINATGSSVGHDLELVIDGELSKPITSTTTSPSTSENTVVVSSASPHPRTVQGASRLYSGHGTCSTTPRPPNWPSMSWRTV